MLNDMKMIGRLTRDPELKVTANGTKITNFSLASNEVWNKDGQKHEKTTFTEWQLFNGSGENLCKITGKGDLIYVGGKFSPDEWTDAEGKKRSRARFTALTWQLLSKVGSGKKEDMAGEANEKPAAKRSRPAKTEKPVKVDNDDDGEVDLEIPF